MGEIVVGAIIQNEDGKFLLVQEAKEKCRGKWNIPCGHLEPNESIIDAIKREVKEETGCIIEPTGVLQIGNMIIPNNTFISVLFSTKLINDEITLNKTELMDFNWLTFDEIFEMKNELRSHKWVVDAINSFNNGEIFDLKLIDIIKVDKKGI